MSQSDLLIRPARADDVPAMMAIYNHYVETSPATFDIVPVTLENRRAWFAHYAETGPFRLVVAEQAGSGTILGYAGSGRFREKPAYVTSVEMTVYVHPDAQRRGVGSRLYGRLFELLADEPLHRAYAGVTLPNPGSLALHRRFGFRDLGVYNEVGHKFGQYWSVHWLEKVLPY
jgi:phosphinothricin acetyltransferase